MEAVRTCDRLDRRLNEGRQAAVAEHGSPAEGRDGQAHVRGVPSHPIVLVRAKANLTDNPAFLLR